MANRFYTVMVVPEKEDKVRQFIIPGWIFKGTLLAVFFSVTILVIMLFDYWYVMRQIGENREIKLENRRLRQQVQVFKNKVANIESTMERVETFTTKLKVITNIEDKDSLVKRLPELPLPDASLNVGSTEAPSTAPNASHADSDTSYDPDEILLKKDQEALTSSLHQLNQQTLYLEQNLQDLYELLADQKSFLSAVPTRKPADGLFTSGFGVRVSPFGGRAKMHEGLDIANHRGTAVKATANGIVRFAGRKPGYGRTVVVDHGYGLETWYGHNYKLLVKKGDRVFRGQQLSAMGSTGRSTGPHVHYEVRIHEIPVDPLSYILEEAEARKAK